MADQRKPGTPPDGLIRELFNAGKTTGEIAKKLGVERSVVASARGRIMEGRAERDRRMDKVRPRPTADERKVIRTYLGFFSKDETQVSVPRVKWLDGGFSGSSTA